jgi:hypothetical protein
MFRSQHDACLEQSEREVSPPPSCGDCSSVKQGFVRLAWKAVSLSQNPWPKAREQSHRLYSPLLYKTHSLKYTTRSPIPPNQPTPCRSSKRPPPPDTRWNSPSHSIRTNLTTPPAHHKMDCLPHTLHDPSQYCHSPSPKDQAYYSHNAREYPITIHVLGGKLAHSRTLLYSPVNLLPLPLATPHIRNGHGPRGRTKQPYHPRRRARARSVLFLRRRGAQRWINGPFPHQVPLKWFLHRAIPQKLYVAVSLF